MIFLTSEDRILMQGGLRCAPACQIPAPTLEIFFSGYRPLVPGYLTSAPGHQTSRPGCLIPVRELLILTSRCHIFPPVVCQGRTAGFHSPWKPVGKQCSGYPYPLIQVLSKSMNSCRIYGMLPSFSVAWSRAWYFIEQARQLFLVKLFHPSGEVPGRTKSRGKIIRELDKKEKQHTGCG